MAKRNFIAEYESMHNWCCYRTGGRARYFARPENTEELRDVIIWADSMSLPHEVIGYGANMLVADSGYDGVVICLREFEKWCFRRDDTVLSGAGMQLNDVVRYACEEALAGLENLSGIPGSIGGALRMNAGAFGTEVKDWVSRINVLELTENGLETHMRDASEAEFGYRSAPGLDGRIVLAAEFALRPGDRAALIKACKEIMGRRAEKQPLNYPSCGSVFKRPESGYAGAYIESSGLKGYTIGGAQVSEKHANFIINLGNATSADIFKLIQLVKLEVHKKSGVLLEEEVRYLGDFF